MLGMVVGRLLSISLGALLGCELSREALGDGVELGLPLSASVGNAVGLRLGKTFEGLPVGDVLGLFGCEDGSSLEMWLGNSLKAVSLELLGCPVEGKLLGRPLS